MGASRTMNIFPKKHDFEELNRATSSALGFVQARRLNGRLGER